MQQIFKKYLFKLIDYTEFVNILIPMNSKNKILDSAQTLLLELIKNGEYGSKKSNLTLEDVAKKIGVNSPQAVKSKVRQLQSKGHIKYTENFELIAFNEPINDIIYLPLLGMAQCGNLGGLSVLEMDYVEKIPFPTRILGITTSSEGELRKYFLVKAKGESMLPTIKNNDILLVKEQKEPNFIDFTLVIHNGEPKVKRVQKFSNKVILVSTNPIEPPKELLDGDTLEIIGVIKKNISTY